MFIQMKNLENHYSCMLRWFAVTLKFSEVTWQFSHGKNGIWLLYSVYYIVCNIMKSLLTFLSYWKCCLYDIGKVLIPHNTTTNSEKVAELLLCLGIEGSTKGSSGCEDYWMGRLCCCDCFHCGCFSSGSSSSCCWFHCSSYYLPISPEYIVVDSILHVTYTSGTVVDS